MCCVRVFIRRLREHKKRKFVFRQQPCRARRCSRGHHRSVCIDTTCCVREIAITMASYNIGVVAGKSYSNGVIVFCGKAHILAEDHSSSRHEAVCLAPTFFRSALRSMQQAWNMPGPSSAASRPSYGSLTGQQTFPSQSSPALPPWKGRSPQRGNGKGHGGKSASPPP